MKDHSDNISIVAGTLAIRDLNVFAPDVRWEDALKRAVANATRIHNSVKNGEMQWIPTNGSPTLLELSIPQLTSMGDGWYKVMGGIFLFNGYLFEENDVFQIGDDGYLTDSYIRQIGDEVYPAVALTSKHELLQYDTYNHTKLGKIDPKILAELGITIDFEKISYAYPEDGERAWDDLGDEYDTGMQQVKYMSVYAPELMEAPSGASLIAAIELDDFEVYGGTLKCYYDSVLVTFNDQSSPFAYVTIETMNVEPIAEDSKESAFPFQYSDNYGKLFDRTVALDSFTSTEDLIARLTAFSAAE